MDWTSHCVQAPVSLVNALVTSLAFVSSATQKWESRARSKVQHLFIYFFIVCFCFFVLFFVCFKINSLVGVFLYFFIQFWLFLFKFLFVGRCYKGNGQIWRDWEMSGFEVCDEILNESIKIYFKKMRVQVSLWPYWYCFLYLCVQEWDFWIMPCF